jgi:hypothetical protein
MGIIVDGKELAGPPNVVVKNFLTDAGVFRFKNQARPAPKVTEVVVHETVTSSWAGTVAVLKQRGLGVHFIVDSDGTIYQHADLLQDEMWHASQHNPMSVGIETVNPFEPSLAPKNGPWKETIVAPWAVGGCYLLPTALQAESVCQLVNWLSSAEANPLTIPQLWPGMNDAHVLALGRVATCKTPPEPGILAHMYWDHGDGAWLVLYAWLRLEAGLDPVDAYAEATRLATGAKSTGVDLSIHYKNGVYIPTADPEITQTPDVITAT